MGESGGRRGVWVRLRACREKKARSARAFAAGVLLGFRSTCAERGLPRRGPRTMGKGPQLTIAHRVVFRRRPGRPVRARGEVAGRWTAACAAGEGASLLGRGASGWREIPLRRTARQAFARRRSACIRSVDEARGCLLTAHLALRESLEATSEAGLVSVVLGAFLGLGAAFRGARAVRTGAARDAARPAGAGLCRRGIGALRVLAGA